MASRKSSESGAVRPGGEVAVDITDAGTAGDGVEYTQISAMLIDKKNTAAAYGKVADADASQIVVAIPAGIPYGEYTLNIFAIKNLIIVDFDIFVYLFSKSSFVIL